jgi:Zn finger protein HypA/HybF involved in hydrogenase expression
MPVQPKTFDTAARRMNAEAERAAQQSVGSQKAAAAAAAATAGRWKQQREQLRQALRAARGGDKGGAAEPTVEIVDYRTQCPHCQRKFNADVADRHIPKCAEARARPSAAGSVRSVKPVAAVSAPPPPARPKGPVAPEAAVAAKLTRPAPSTAKPAAAAAKGGISGACFASTFARRAAAVRCAGLDTGHHPMLQVGSSRVIWRRCRRRRQGEAPNSSETWDPHDGRPADVPWHGWHELSSCTVASLGLGGGVVDRCLLRRADLQPNRQKTKKTISSKTIISFLHYRSEYP